MARPPLRAALMHDRPWVYATAGLDASNLHVRHGLHGTYPQRPIAFSDAMAESDRIRPRILPHLPTGALLVDSQSSALSEHRNYVSWSPCGLPRSMIRDGIRRERERLLGPNVHARLPRVEWVQERADGVEIERAAPDRARTAPARPECNRLLELSRVTAKAPDPHAADCWELDLSEPRALELGRPSRARSHWSHHCEPRATMRHSCHQDG